MQDAETLSIPTLIVYVGSVVLFPQLLKALKGWSISLNSKRGFCCTGTALVTELLQPLPSVTVKVTFTFCEPQPKEVNVCVGLVAALVLLSSKNVQLYVKGASPLTLEVKFTGVPEQA